MRRERTGWRLPLTPLLLCVPVLQAATPTPMAAPQARAVNAQTALERGLQLYLRDRASLEAQRLLAQASKRLPKRHDVHLALLDSYLVHTNTKAAAALLRTLEAEERSSPRLAFDAIYYLLQHRQMDLAQDHWRRLQAHLLDAAPQEQGERFFVQGLLAAAAHDNNEAMRLLQLADSHGFPPLASRQMLVLADTLYELHEERLAVPTYREFLKHWPDDNQARLHLALALQASGELADAQQELERVLSEDPQLPGASYFLGSVLFAQRRNGEAKLRFEREVKLHPQCLECMAKLAHIAYLAGEDQTCRSWLEKAAALNPAWHETNLVYGMLEIREEKYASAIRHLSRVVEQFPSHVQAHYQLQIAYQRSGNAEKAREHAEAFRKLTQEQKARTTGRPR